MGLLITILGLIFQLIGVIMLFQRTLICFGSLALILGPIMVISDVTKIIKFFKSNWIGITIFLTGFAIILFLNFTVIGFIIQSIGLCKVFWKLISSRLNLLL